MAVAVGQPVVYRGSKNLGTDLSPGQVTRIQTAGNPGIVDIVVWNDTQRTTAFISRVTWRSTDNGAADICFPIASLS